MAATARVLVLHDDHGSAARQLVTTMIGELRSADASLKITSVGLHAYKQRQRPAPDDVDLIVSVGDAPAEFVAGLAAPTPLYFALLSKSAYDRLRVNARAEVPAGSSVIYLDQPWSRQFGLVRLALPGVLRVGAVLGPESAGATDEIRSAARAQGLTARPVKVRSPAEVAPATHKMLAGSDLLLLVPDPVVLNDRTLRGLFLDSMHAGKPVLGFSQSSVDAGAVLAVYSTPVDLGRQLAEDILSMAATDGWDRGSSAFPRYYNVAVNRSVARVLGLELEDGRVLTRKLRAGGA